MRKLLVLGAIAVALVGVHSASAATAEQRFHHVGQTLRSTIPHGIHTRAQYCREVPKRDPRVVSYFTCVPSQGQTISIVVHYRKAQRLGDGHHYKRWLVILDFKWKTGVMLATLADAS